MTLAKNMTLQDGEGCTRKDLDSTECSPAACKRRSTRTFERASRSAGWSLVNGNVGFFSPPYTATCCVFHILYKRAYVGSLRSGRSRRQCSAFAMIPGGSIQQQPVVVNGAGGSFLGAGNSGSAHLSLLTLNIVSFRFPFLALKATTS